MEGKQSKCCSLSQSKNHCCTSPAMKIFVNESYGGSICSMKFERDAQRCFGYAVRILGFVETNKVKIQHVSSQGRFVTDEIRFKVPHNIIPSFESKNFKVWYICECDAISKNAKAPFSFVFEIANNNFEDFQYSGPIELDLNLVEEKDYLEKKESICRLILSRMEEPLDPKSLLMPVGKDEKPKESVSFIQHNAVLGASSPELSPEQQPTLQESAPAVCPDSIVLSQAAVPESLDNRMYALQSSARHGSPGPEKIVVEDPETDHQDPKMSKDKTMFPREVNEEIQSLIAQLAAEDALREQMEARHEDVPEEWCPDPELGCQLQAIRHPSFRDPNLLEIRSYESTSTAVEGKDTIACITYPSFLRGQAYIRIKYLRNVRSTHASIWRQDYEEGCMIDTESVFSITFDSDDCFEKVLEFSIQGFSLSNFVFEVRYILSISFDGSEISLPLNVLSPDAKAYISPVEV